MNISDQLKTNIKQEFEDFKKRIFEEEGISEYGLKEGETGKRKELDQFYTPPELTIQMLEMFDFKTLEDFAKEKILDPTCGSGNLIMAALIIGLSVDNTYPEKVFGNELDEVPLEVCRNRFTYYCKTHGVPQYDKNFWNIHLHKGNALEKSCIEEDSFTSDYWFDEKTGKRGVGKSNGGFSLNKRK